MSRQFDSHHVQPSTGCLWATATPSTAKEKAGAAALVKFIKSETAVPAIKKLGFDPAIASSIFVTTFTDVGGFFSFLGLATLAMRTFGRP